MYPRKSRLIQCFPRLYAAASLKPCPPRACAAASPGGFPRLYAAASLKLQAISGITVQDAGFPRLYAAASLKQHHSRTDLDAGRMFSAALCRGLIEAQWVRWKYSLDTPWFSAALCRGLIEALGTTRSREPAPPGFPRLYAAASLKLGIRDVLDTLGDRFPRLYAAASLKPCGFPQPHSVRFGVFRGFMPRPH